jgi:hypothetical protein
MDLVPVRPVLFGVGWETAFLTSQKMYVYCKLFIAVGSKTFFWRKLSENGDNAEIFRI